MKNNKFYKNNKQKSVIKFRNFRIMKDNNYFNINNYWDKNKKWTKNKTWNPETPWMFCLYRKHKLVPKFNLYVENKSKNQRSFFKKKNTLLITSLLNKQLSEKEWINNKVSAVISQQKERGFVIEDDVIKEESNLDLKVDSDLKNKSPWAAFDNIKKEAIKTFYESMPEAYVSTHADKPKKELFQLSENHNLYYIKLRKYRAHSGLGRLTSLLSLFKFFWGYLLEKSKSKVKIKNYFNLFVFKYLFFSSFFKYFFLNPCWSVGNKPVYDQVWFDSGINSNTFLLDLKRDKKLYRWGMLKKDAWKRAIIDRDNVYYYSSNTAKALFEFKNEVDPFEYNRLSSLVLELSYLKRKSRIYSILDRYFSILWYSKFLNSDYYLEHFSVFSGNMSLKDRKIIDFINNNYFYLCSKIDKNDIFCKIINKLDIFINDIGEVFFFVERLLMFIDKTFFTEEYFSKFIMRSRFMRFYLRYSKDCNFILQNGCGDYKVYTKYFYDQFASQRMFKLIEKKYPYIKMRKSRAKRKDYSFFLLRYILQLFFFSSCFERCLKLFDELPFFSNKMKVIKESYLRVSKYIQNNNYSFSILCVLKALKFLFRLFQGLSQYYKLNHNTFLSNINKVVCHINALVSKKTSVFDKINNKSLASDDKIIVINRDKSKMDVFSNISNSKIKIKIYKFLFYLFYSYLNFIKCFIFNSKLSLFSYKVLEKEHKKENKKESASDLVFSMLNKTKKPSLGTKDNSNLFDKLFNSKATVKEKKQNNFVLDGPLSLEEAFGNDVINNQDNVSNNDKDKLKKKRLPYRLRPINLIYSSSLRCIFEKGIYQYIISTRFFKIMFRKNSILFRFKARNLKGMLVFGYDDEGNGLINDLKMWGTYDLIEFNYFNHFKSLISLYFNCLSLDYCSYNSYLLNYTFLRNIMKKKELLKLSKSHNLTMFFYFYLRFYYFNNYVYCLKNNLISTLKYFLIKLNKNLISVLLSKDFVCFFLFFKRIKSFVFKILTDITELNSYYVFFSSRIKKIYSIFSSLTRITQLNAFCNFNAYSKSNDLIERFRWKKDSIVSFSEWDDNIYYWSYKKRTRSFLGRYYKTTKFYKRFVFLRLLNLFFYWIIYFFSTYWIYYLRITFNLWLRMMNLIKFNMLNNFSFCSSLSFVVNTTQFYFLSSSIEVLYYLRNFYNYSVKIYKHLSILGHSVKFKEHYDYPGSYKYVYKRKQFQLKLVVKGVDFNYGLKMKNI